MAAALQLLTLQLFAVTQITVFTLPWLNSHPLMRRYAVTNWLEPPFSFHSLYMNLLYTSPNFNCCLLTYWSPTHPPPQDLRGIRLLQFKNFQYLKIRTKPHPYIGIDFLWQRLDPSGPPQCAESLPFNTFLYFITLLCLTRGQSILLAHILSTQV